ncbi:collagenase-like [Teleopsis dalmanni]|uniref:collagenase-like n=1 Tax=Teleopsis dalmanni TaxID=139649 RepID=UPI0018CE96C9|nr:collagenase-like [Teleopsis dalmanni]
MKFLAVFVLALATATAFDLRSNEIHHLDVEVPVLDGPDGRITNGKTATTGQFPYQVGLSIKKSALSSAWCGGSLIGKNWVLTAAHCTISAKSVTVYLGATVRTSPEVSYNVDASDIIVHTGYNSKTIVDDISLIKIPSVTYSSKIQVVKLPSIASTYSTYTGDNVIASGWGRTSDAVTTVTTNLQWADLVVISNTKCAATYGTASVVASKICCSTPNKVSTCQGDSGGPLVLASSKVQIGLTSFGAEKGCELGYPVAFTRLTSYLNWIKSYTGISY